MIAQDQTDLTAATKEYNVDAKARKDIEATLLSAAQQTGDWPDALKNLAAAKADLEAAEKKVTDKLVNDTKYKAALAANTKAQKDLADARSSTDPDPSILTPLANNVLDTAKALDKIKTAAYDYDPGVRAAREKVKTAQAVVDKLRAAFDATLADNSDWKAAKATEDDAHQKVMDAQAKLAADKSGKPAPAPAPAGGGQSAPGAPPGPGGQAGTGAGASTTPPPGMVHPPGAPPGVFVPAPPSGNDN
jgi:hypothetical protein